MRDIKFRAWDGECMMDNLDSINLEMLREGAYTEDGETILPCVYMQYTGLKDKNGKEIYEGDVVKVLETAHSENDLQKQLRGTNADYDICEYVGVVTWDDEGCDYSLIQQGQTIEDAVGFPRHMYEHEVIGNIYESPELLK